VTLDLVGKRYLWFLISALFILPGAVSLIWHGLDAGIDFTGGTSWEFQTSTTPETEPIKAILAAHGYDDSVVQISNGDTVLIRMKELREGSTEKAAILSDIQQQYGEIKPNTEQLSTVGPSVGAEIRNRAIVAVILASVGVLLYIAYAFRNTNNPALYGICAIVAMLHDVMIVLGVFSILGWIHGVEIDALFVTALLTVIGFSVHDTIVVFDRVRENLTRHIAPTFEETVNYSVVQTMVRSLNTSVTVVLTLLALYLFGGESTRWFVMTLMIGVIAGAYSSIFNASQLLVAWETGEIKRFFRGDWLRKRNAGPRTKAV
jgi:preprotein translocase subunit SecF